MGEGVRHLDLDQPSLGVGVFGQDLDVARDRLVDLDHLATDRRVEVADRLDALDLAERLPLRQGGSDLGQVDHDQVGELVDSELGDCPGWPRRLRGGPTRGLACT